MESMVLLKLVNRTDTPFRLTASLNGNGFIGETRVTRNFLRSER
jgi:hypothetical protein